MSAPAAVAAPVEAADWKSDREAVLEQLRIVDMIHEGKPACRLCGQLTNGLDRFGLCSKISPTHREWRGDVAPAKKARKR